MNQLIRTNLSGVFYGHSLKWSVMVMILIPLLSAFLLYLFVGRQIFSTAASTYQQWSNLRHENELTWSLISNIDTIRKDNQIVQEALSSGLLPVVVQSMEDKPIGELILRRANNNNITIVSLVSTPPVMRSGLEELNMKLVTSGEFLNQMRFIRKIENESPSLAINELLISATPNNHVRIAMTLSALVNIKW